MPRLPRVMPTPVISQAEMEARVDPKNIMYGVDEEAAAELARWRESGGVTEAPLAPLPSPSRLGEFAQSGAYVEALSVMHSMEGDVTGRSRYNQLNVENFGLQGVDEFYEGMSPNGPRYNNKAGTVAGSGPARDRTDAPAPMTVVPTSSSNLERPRTVAAGWEPYPGEKSIGKLSVIFRDGTYYNYYDVTASEWQRFKMSGSKGPLLNQHTTPGYSNFLYYKPRGEATTDFLSEKAQELEYDVARTAQQVYGVTDKGVRINGRMRNRQDFARPATTQVNLTKRAAKVYGKGQKPRRP